MYFSECQSHIRDKREFYVFEVTLSGQERDLDKSSHCHVLPVSTSRSIVKTPLVTWSAILSGNVRFISSIKSEILCIILSYRFSYKSQTIVILGPTEGQCTNC